MTAPGSMPPPKIQYGRSRYPTQPEKKKCRGCHGDVPKGRSSWCSNKCYDAFEPKRVRWFCQQRDKYVCHHCGVDSEKMRARYEHANRWTAPNQYRYLENGIFQREKYDAALKIAHRHERRWRAAAKKRMAAMRADGWPSHACRDWWEMDHVTPYSEGGLTVLENVRTLCIPCHKKRTKKWHKDRKQPNSPSIATGTHRRRSRPRMVRPPGEPWECFHPANQEQSARAWLGRKVICRPDGGGWPLETGIVHADENHAPENGWFKLVNARYPAGILTHTQEVYPPGFTGCTLPCCRPK